MENQLDVVTCYFNPIQYKTIRDNHTAFVEHMQASNVRLIVVECALGQRPFEVTCPDNPNHLQVRSSSVLWLKENLLNLGFRLAKSNYVAWVDGDVTFRDSEWAAMTVDALQRFKIVQPWSDVYDLAPKRRHMGHFRSFCRQWYHREPFSCVRESTYPYWHCGFAWAARREILVRLGGLLDRAILGSADHHMAMSLIGKAAQSIHKAMPKAYFDYVLQWQDKAQFHVNEQIGYVPGTIEHTWHGSKQHRKYWDRWDILTKAKYDPFYDVKYNLDGVLELERNKADLQHGIDEYFAQRNEDANTLD